ncbi:MAG: RagB/SusD family nutrient uptake outer membrane protein [Sediminicola sp.]|tara:strand:- start:8991 stop:10673 length:1683 start_codon:yes stop_codon:yes gene_type:complete
MKKILGTLILIAVLVSACNNDLDLNPQGTLSDSDLQNVEAVDALVIASYALLDGVYDGPTSTIFNPASNWSYSDVRSDDAYKGGGGTGDIGELNNIEIGVVTSDNSLIFRKWRALQLAVKRCNMALKALNDITVEAMPNKISRAAEVRVLRSHYYFELKKHFHVFPWIDENVPAGEEETIPNDLSSEQLWANIENDLINASADLTETPEQPGRISALVADAYLTKVFMFQGKFEDAIEASNSLVGGPFGLQNDLEALYSDPTVEHNGENIFAVEVNIGGGGSNGGNLFWGDLLCSPPGPAYGGGDNFQKPTQNLVNAFKVDENGLPLFDSFNDNDLEADDTTTPIDPRLDLAIGRPGIPWKDYTGEVYGPGWIRALAEYGPYSRKKNLISPNSPLRANPGGFPWARGALNFPLIKYSDILLLRAEAFIEIGDTESARSLINEVRLRAANTPWVQKLDGSGPAANYQIGLYPQSGFNQEYARMAVRMERRLELCLEGHRFYDLVRWGNAKTVLETYFEQEADIRPYLGGAVFLENRHEYLPIPQQEIDNSKGVYTQNQFYQ